MISDVGALLSAVLELFKTEFSIYGFTFSFWQIFCFTVVASIVCWLIGEVLLGD